MTVSMFGQLLSPQFIKELSNSFRLSTYWLTILTIEWPNIVGFSNPCVAGSRHLGSREIFACAKYPKVNDR